MLVTKENKINLFNDFRDIQIQEIRGKYLYENLFQGTISLDSIGELDKYCLNLHIQNLQEQEKAEVDKLIRSVCDNENQEDIVRQIHNLNIKGLNINEWKYLLNTVSYLDFIDYNMDIIDTLKDLPVERKNAIDRLNKKFIQIRGKEHPEHVRLNKEYKELLERFNRTATKTEQIIRMGYYYAAVLKEQPYSRMIDFYKKSDPEIKYILSDLAKRYGYEH